MVTERTRNIARNVITGFGYRFVHILMPFITRSVIILMLGQEYLGLNTLFTSIFTFLNLAEFGFASALTYKMYEPAAREDFETLSAYCSVIRKVYRAIGLLILCLGMSIMPFLKHFIKGSCPPDVNVYLLFAIYLLNTIIPYLGAGYCTSIFTAFQRVDIPNAVNAVITLSLNVIQIVILVMTKAYYPYIFCIPLFTLINNLALLMLKKKYFNKIDVKRIVRKDILRETYSSAGALFGHSLNYVIVSSADNIVISSFLGLSMLALYGNYYTILSAVLGLIDVVIQSCTPSIGNLMLEKDKMYEKNIFKAISFLTYWITGWSATCLICLYQPFMLIWMGKDMLLPFSTVMLFACYLYSYKGRAAIVMFKDAAGMWSADLLKPYISAIFNIVLNVILVKTIGLNGVLISTIMSFICINFPWESRVLLDSRYPDYKKKYYIDFAVYAMENIVIGAFTYMLCRYVTLENIFADLVVKGMICVVVPNTVWLLINRNKSECAYIFDKFMNIQKR